MVGLINDWVFGVVEGFWDSLRGDFVFGVFWLFV